MSNSETATKRTGVLTMCSSWADVRATLDPGEVLHVDPKALPHPADVGMNQSYRSLHALTARPVWRDDRDTESLQVIEYGDYYAARVTEFNPDEGVTSAVAHAAFEESTKTALAAVVGLTTYHGLADDAAESDEAKSDLPF